MFLFQFYHKSVPLAWQFLFNCFSWVIVSKGIGFHYIVHYRILSYCIHFMFLFDLIKLIMKNWFQFRFKWISVNPHIWWASRHQNKRWYPDWLATWGRVHWGYSFFTFHAKYETLTLAGIIAIIMNYFCICRL